MALISWKQISPELLSYGKLTGSLEVSGSIVSDGNLLPSTEAEFDLGSVDKPWRDLYLHTASLKFVKDGAVLSSIVGETDAIKVGNIRITTSSIDVVNNSNVVIKTIVQASSSQGDVVGTEVDPSIFSLTGSVQSTENDLAVTGSLLLRLDGSQDIFKVNVNGEDKLEINTEGTVVYKPLATVPTYVSGGLFYSSSGDFYVG